MEIFEIEMDIAQISGSISKERVDIFLHAVEEIAEVFDGGTNKLRSVNVYLP